MACCMREWRTQGLRAMSECAERAYQRCGGGWRVTSEKSERCSKLLHPYSTRSKLIGIMPQESWRMEEI